jgi:hypothetical protein
MDNKNTKKQIINEKVKQNHKKKVIENPEIRKVLNERSKASYKKKKEQEKLEGVVKNKRGRPPKQPTEKKPAKPRGRPVTIKPST